MNKVKLADNINWVGVIDWNIHDFHGYVTRRGTSYNSYLILDKQNALVDTVKYTFSEEFVKKVSESTDIEKLDFIIINHLEKDHSSSLPLIAKFAKNATIITSQRGKDAIFEHYGSGYNIKTVKTGDEISLGNRTLRFIESPMLHWPDSMLTYIVEDEILLSNDAFGQHFASAFRFDDQVDENTLMEQAKTYYANILMPLGSLVSRKIQEIVKLGISPKIIAPSHGIIWRSNPSKIIQAYLDWSICKSDMKVTIVFDTMWGSTDIMARSIAEGVISQGIEAKLLKLRSAELTDIVTEILSSKAVIVGSPTLNQQMFPSLSAFLTYITGLKPKGKIWSFFGSYGWSRGAVKDMTEMAKKAGFDIIESGLEVKYVPTKRDLDNCYEFGKQIALKLKN